MKLLIVRHGQTNWNAETRYQGASDIELNDTGRKQAGDVAIHLQKNYTIDLIISSPLKRAKETANIIAAELNRDVYIMDQFSERNVGVFEGLTQQEAKKRYPDIWAQNITRHLNTAPPKGETILEVGARVLDGLNYLRMQYKDKNVLLIAHGYISRMINGIVNCTPDEKFNDFRLENGEVALFEF